MLRKFARCCRQPLQPATQAPGTCVVPRNAACLAKGEGSVGRSRIDATAPGRRSLQVESSYLTGRVLVGEEKKQRYGTQLQPHNGEPTPLPLENSENVDQRRAAMGLSSLAE